MKILVLSYEYPPIGGGGGAICKNISVNLSKLGNEVTILTTAFPSTLTPHHSPIKNLSIIRLPSLRKKIHESNPVEMLSWISTTKKYIMKHPGFLVFDVCMAHFVLPGGEVARWMKKKYGLPYVLISHGHDIPWVHPRQMFLFHLVSFFWIRVICRQSLINFVQTRMMKENIDRFMGRRDSEKNVIIPNGVDTSTFFPDYGRRPAKLRIIFTGRLVSQKDPMTFLKAIRLFRRETNDFEVHILGDGRLRKKMERYVSKNELAEHVVFMGKVSEESIVEEYQSAHLMVAPSLNEGMSIAALEALSCGVYLIATRASGFEDMIQEGVNGEFVDFRNPYDICQKLKSFWVEKEEGVTVLEKSAYRIPEIYGWEAISGEYSTLMSNLFSKSEI